MLLVAFVERTKEHDVFYFRDHTKELDKIEMDDDKYYSTIGLIAKMGYKFTQNWLSETLVVLIEGVFNEALNQLLYELSREEFDDTPDEESDFDDFFDLDPDDELPYDYDQRIGQDQ